MTEAGALLVSVAIEAPVASLIVRLMKWPCRGAVHVGLAAAVATMATHPQLWSAALWAYSRFAYWPSTIVLEAMVIVVEGAMIAWMTGLTFPRAMFVSFIANAASFYTVIAYYLVMT